MTTTCASTYNSQLLLVSCMLQEAGLTDGVNVDRTALETAASGLNDPRFTEALDSCPQTDQGLFLDCWSLTAPRLTAVIEAEKDAMEGRRVQLHK